MKNSILTNVKIWACLFVLTLSIACQKDEIANEITNTEIVDTPLVSLKNGFLRFKDRASFEKIRTELKNASLEEQASWEQQFGNFKSQFTIYNELIENDLTFKLQLEQLPAAAIEQLKNKKGDQYHYHTSVLEYQNLLSFQEDESFLLHVEGMDRDIEKFIGRNGLLQIGNSIYQYGTTQIKVITDGDEKKISQLANYTKSSENENIQVLNFTRKIISEEIRQKTFSGNMSCSSKKGKRRLIGNTIIGYTSRASATCSNQIEYQGYAYFKAQSRIKIAGKWRPKPTHNLRIIGTNIEFRLGNNSGKNIRVDESNANSKKSSLIADIFQTDGWSCEPIDGTMKFTGDVTFYGPKNTSCSPELHFLKSF